MATKQQLPDGDVSKLDQQFQKWWIHATSLFCCVFRMLWSVNGWSWSDEFPNLSSRSSTVARGHCGGQGISEAKRS
ncbi:uncharacterized protein LOC130933150 isoform X2 [Arachis stenosperma]|uniref:uncharacterized protein LOC130933150 isoform X2 n=1 Tax=Arachis stenosperma TaxID=217475 RepID=UPI0025AC9AB8|nr:uncharacterized protein LOC130933150 isoform X2 [Arachis stenosperma]